MQSKAEQSIARHKTALTAGKKQAHGQQQTNKYQSNRNSKVSKEQAASKEQVGKNNEKADQRPAEG